MSHIPHFDAILEDIETLPDDDQQVMVELIRQRMAARRRAEIAVNIAVTREEYRTGQVRRGTVDDLIAEMDQ